ncbi:PH domain-containing protein [Arthrobacter sp. NPDC057259]|uniref:PH domain-containing protein n=1 Tax=Arthrobacter sp. NPDC057259 TaxID=3346073 RepID=UPI00362C09EC
MNGGTDNWQRVHPASPFVRGWLALAALFFFFGRDAAERLLRGGPVFDERFAGRAPWLLLGGGTMLLLVVAGFVLSWYFTRYQVAGGFVRVTTGVLVKQHRQARLDRVQAIDVVQPLLARIFGLAELRFEVADAGQSAVHLAYLRVAEARRLRAAILDAAVLDAAVGEAALRGAAGQAAAVPVARGHDAQVPAALPGPDAPAEPPERPVLTVPPRRLAGSLLLSEQAVVLLLGAATSVLLAAFTENRSFSFYLVPAGIGILAGFWAPFSKGYNFTAAASQAGIRLQYGLLDTLAQTLPPGRIQALRISQPPLWRPLGWYRIQVNVAGYGTPGQDGQRSARTTLLPVGTLQDVTALLDLVLPDGAARPGSDQSFAAEAEGPDAHAVLAAGLSGLAPAARIQARRDPAHPTGSDDGGFTTTPRRARLLAPLGWRRNGFAVTGSALLIRTGRWWRHLTVVPHGRTQSIALHQGPVARRFGVVDLVLHTTSGPVAPRVIQAGLAEGRALLLAQAAHLSPKPQPVGNPAEDPQEGPQHG